VVADGGWDSYGFTAEVAALVASSSLVTQLKAPVVRLGLPPSPAPMSVVLERAYFKDVSSLTADLRRLMRDAYGLSPDSRVRPVEYAV
jgi:pyruvate/2-oxoglutarate/acetoin dehydrogenase E1 component